MQKITIWTLLGMICLAGVVHAQVGASISQRTVGLERAEGFIPFYWDAASGRILFEIQRLRLGEDVLYYVSIAQGAGSVELGMDRGVTRQLVVRFERVGPRVHVVQQNLRFRAPNGHPALVENVRESFATSILASLPIEAEEGSRLLVDATPLVLRDAADITGRLRQRDQGTFRLDPDRSSIYPERTKTFCSQPGLQSSATISSAGTAPSGRGAQSGWSTNQMRRSSRT